VIGKLEFEEEQELPPVVCVEPAHIPIEGILSARSVNRGELSVPKSSHVTHRPITVKWIA
jgi:hypothetical protein